MTERRISLVVATDEGGLIGRDGALPWHLPADLRHFKELTLGKPIIMGRKTHESIGRTLPGRTNIVLTRRTDYSAPGCVVAHDIPDALDHAGDVDEVMVIGGSEIYRVFLPSCHRIYQTMIHHRFEGDTHFPTLEPGVWRVVSRTDHDADEKNPHAFSWLVLERAP